MPVSGAGISATFLDSLAVKLLVKSMQVDPNLNINIYPWETIYIKCIYVAYCVWNKVETRGELILGQNYPNNDEEITR